MKKTSLSFLMLLGLYVVGLSAAWAQQGMNPRYQLIGDGSEVWDKKTDLVWQRCSYGQRWKSGMGCVGVVKRVDWTTAKTLENGVWRLPSKDELATLIDYARKKAEQPPVSDPVAFPDMPIEEMPWYWSGTTEGASLAWLVGFGLGTVGSSARSNAVAVRLVRGGQ